MDPQHSAQDVLRCDLCDTPVQPMYICHINYVYPVLGYISQSNPKSMKWCHLKSGGLQLNVQNIPIKCLNFTVKNAVFFARSPFFLGNIRNTKALKY